MQGHHTLTINNLALRRRFLCIKEAIYQSNEHLQLYSSFCALFIKRKFNIADEETVLQIQENAYLQYFIGFHEFTIAQPFAPSLMVSFRKRIPEEILNEINEHLFLDGKSDDKDDNQGTLIIDTTFAPSDSPIRHI